MRREEAIRAPRMAPVRCGKENLKMQEGHEK